MPEPGPAQPRIGVDEWVATADERTERYRGFFGPVARAIDSVPQPVQLAVFALAAASLPFLTSNGYIVRVGFDTLLYMLLALGLNVVVGWAGLLDLGYVAFYGFGAYSYAMLASPKFGLHWPTYGVVPLVVVAALCLGYLVGLSSGRLSGDYLAIVTLFFGQFFVTVYTNGERLSFLGLTRSYDVTGGPNGIADIDSFNAFGRSLDPFSQLKGYYWVALAVFVVVLGGLSLLDRSRTGRAWRSLREDPLAAELMGMPVRRLKLVAFALGAAVAGLTGTLFAALNSAVFASSFDAPLLIVVYAMVILGGAGSLQGVVLGAIAVNVSLEVLRTPGHATWIFYVLLAATLLARLRPWRWLVGVAGGTLAFGFAVRALAVELWPSQTDGTIASAGALGSVLKHWVVLLSDPRVPGNYAFVGLVLALLALTTLRGAAQKVALVPVLYLAAFVWQNRLVQEPSVTRLILVGALLIVLMNARPQGLVGTSRVEIV
ncbi:MAG TPA: branched-chain amino acid ABC transporter permease [Gaiellaceae bacterium]|nr:branched-chain amino acid ABC transporter permease [Gaiellaceae bacterium]